MKPSRKLLTSVIFFSMSSHLLHAAADITISNGLNTDITAASPFKDVTDNGGPASNLNTATLVSALGGGSVLVDTATSTGISAFGGKITAIDLISWSSANNLSLVANSEILAASNIIANAGGSLSLTANNLVTLNANVELSGGTSNLTVLSGGITQDPTRKLVISGAADLSGGAGSVTLLGANEFGSLKLAGTDVQVNEVNSTLLTGVAASSLNLTTNGTITDSSGAVINVNGLATFNSNGNAIILGDNATDVTNFGKLNLTGSAISINEDSATELAGVSASSLNLTSNGTITDSGNVVVSGLAQLNAGANDITIGDAVKNTTFGTLTFTGSAVTISEDDSTLLTGTSTGTSLRLTSSGGITNDSSANLNITNNASFTGTSITLGTTLGDAMNFGSLTFYTTGTGAVTISEDSAMELTGLNKGGVTTLTALDGAITDSGITTNIDVGALTLDGKSINLGAGTFNATTINFKAPTGDVTISEDSSMDLIGSNTANSATLSSTNALSDALATNLSVTGLGSFSGTSISLGAGIFNTGFLNFNSTGAVNIQEDTATALSGTNKAGDLTLNSTGEITDTAATSLSVTGNAFITSGTGTSIILDDTAFNVVGNTIFTAGSGHDIIANNTSNVFTGNVTFVASTGTLANVNIYDTTNFDLKALTLTGALTARSGGILTDSGNLAITGLATLSGSTSINIGGASETTNFFSLNFNSGGSVTIQEDSSTLLSGTSTGLSLALNSVADITNDTTANLNISNNASFNGTSISLGTVAGDAMNFGSLTFNSSGAVTISEDSAMEIIGSNTGAATTLTSSGAITDSGSSNSINVGALKLNGSSINLGAGTFNASSLNFTSTGAVNISEDSNMDLVGVNTAGSATLSSTGALSDTGATSVAVTGLGSFSGNSISLGGGLFNTGTLTFNSSGTVNISEDSSMDIVGVNTGGITSLTSTAGISDTGATSINVGALTLNGTSINLGAGTFNANTINFNTAGAVNISEDSNMDLVGVNTAGSATLSSTGVLSDAGATSVVVTGLGSFNGATISLGGGLFNTGSLTFNASGAVNISEDSSMDIVGVNTGGITSLTSTAGISDTGATSINVGALTLNGTSINLGAGTFNASTLNFNSSGSVIISEDSSMDIVGINTGAATSLTSTSGISDAGAISINIGALTLNGTSINLGAGIFNASTLNFNSAGAVNISEDSSMDLVGVNAAGSATLSSVGVLSDAGATSIAVTGLGSFSGASISLGGGLFNTGSLTFNSSGAVTINEDSSMDIVGVNTGGPTTLTSLAGISDAGATSINVGALTLNGTSINLGAGIFNASTLNFHSAGAVNISEDSNMDLVGANTAGSATLSSVGALSDAGATSVEITGLGNFSGASISLGGGIFDTGTLTFNSSGAVNISEDSSMDIVGANTGGATTLTSLAGISDSGAASINVGALTLNGTSINLGAGIFNASTLNFHSAGAVNISEDSNMDLVGVNTAGSATLSSVGALSDAGATSVEITGFGNFSGASISLGGGLFDTGNLTFNSAGTVNISEDSSMDIVGANTGGVTTLTSLAGISDTGASSINVGALTLNGTSINLGAGIFNASTLNFNSVGAVNISEDSNMDLVGVNTAGSATLSSVGALSDTGATSVEITGLGNFSGASISIGGGLFNAGTLTFNSSGAVNISEDSSMDIVGANTGGATTLTSLAGISDTGAASINVGALALNGTSINLGAGILNASTLNFNSAGAVNISEDSSMDIVGTNTAGIASLSAAGALSDAGATSVEIAGLGNFSSATISLGGGIFDTGTLTFNSSGTVNISEDSSMDIVGANTGGATTLTSLAGISDTGAASINVGALALNGTTINLGAGTFNASTLNFNSAGAVNISEDSAMDIVGTNTAGSASLSAAGALSDAGATRITITGLGNFSGNSIDLGGGIFDVGTLTFNSTGTVNIIEDSSMNIVGANTSGTTSLTSVAGISDAGATSINVGALTLNGTSIELGAGTFNASTLNFNAAGAVNIIEDSTMDIVGANTAGSAMLASTGALSDAGATSITIIGHGDFSGDSISIGGGIFNTGALTFNSAGEVSFSEDSNMDIVGTSTGGAVYLNATGAISDAAATDIEVGALALDATSINLGGGIFNADSLTFNSVGAVNIFEDSSTELVGISEAGTLTLSSAGTLMDHSDLTVAGLATLSGTSMVIGGDLQTTNFGALNVNSIGTVSVQEDSDTLFVGANSASTLTLYTSTASIFTVGSTLDATTLDVLRSTPVFTTSAANTIAPLNLSNTVVLSGNNLVDSMAVNLSYGTTLLVNGADTIATLTSNSGTIDGDATLTLTHGASLNDGTRILGHLLGDTTSNGAVLIDDGASVGGGILHVQSGTLSLFGTANSKTTVDAGATLKGTGTVDGNLLNHGTLRVDSMGDHLTVTGKLVTKGNLALSLDSDALFERIDAGKANLGGHLIVTNTDSGLSSGEVAQIIVADTYTNGFDSFKAVGFDNGLLFNDRTGTLIGLAGGGLVNDGGYLNLNANQSNVYLALFEDSVQPGVRNVTRTDNPSGSGYFVNFKSGVANGDSQLVSALYQATFANPGSIDINTVNSLSPEVHRGMADYTEQALRSHVREAVDAAPVSRKGKTQVFATTHTTSDGVDNSVTNAGYDIESIGATAGARYDINANFRIGGLFGMDNGSIKGSLIDTDAQGVVIGAFSRYQFNDPGKTMITGSITYGDYSYDATRHSFGGDVTADGVGSNAVELALGVSTTIYEKDGLRFSPNGALRYMTGSVDAFEEQGGGVHLAVDSQDIESVLLDIGMDMNYQINEQFSLAGRVGYVNNLSDSDEPVSAGFAATGTSGQPFSVAAPGIQQQAVTLGLGLFYDINDSVRAGLSYRGEFRTDSQSSQSIGVGVSFGF